MKCKKRKAVKINITPIFLLAFFLIISIAVAQRIESANYVLSRAAIDSGGGNFTSANYFLELSTEPIGGNSSSNTYAVCIGLNCCPADAYARTLNATVNETENTTTISFALWHADICMGTTNVTVECAASCNPCTQSCSLTRTQHTLTLTDFLFGRQTMNISNENITNAIYCKVTDDTWQLERCFNSATNLTVTAEAGGPYSGTSATVIVAGNTTFDEGTIVPDANITINLYPTGNLSTPLSTVSTNTSTDGKYFATFYNLAIGSYRVNVTAKYQSAVGNVTDTFDVISVYGNCQVKTISLSGKALDATTGLKVQSGTASITIKETGDSKDTPVADGSWGTDINTCLLSGETYTLTVKITDNLGKVSWSGLQFVAP